MNINRKEWGELEALLRAANQSRDDYAASVDKFNEAMTVAWEAVEAALGKMNDARNAAKERIEGIAGDKQSELDDKSERWQEGERGTAAREWIDAIEQAASNLDEIDADKPDDVEVSIDDIDLDFEDRPCE